MIGQTDGRNDLLPVIKYGFEHEDDELGNRGYGSPMNAASRSDLLTMFVRPSVRRSSPVAGKHAHAQRARRLYFQCHVIV